jgi:hypothetical protein
METVVGMGRVAATKAVAVEGTAVKNREGSDIGKEYD